MKICFWSIELAAGKYPVKDNRLDLLNQLVPAKKKTYVQVEVVKEDGLKDSDCIVIGEDNKLDLILKDLEFVETRLSRAEAENEVSLLKKLKAALEKEEWVSRLTFSAEEKQFISTYGLATAKPIVAVSLQESINVEQFLQTALKESGFISFFTAGEKETRAWLIKNGTTAWEAAGVIHTDIQRGFIRAEIISFEDFVKAGSENEAKRQGLMRLEPKEYLMQDADIANFRFNK